jgi:hypothetical protein
MTSATARQRPYDEIDLSLRPYNLGCWGRFDQPTAARGWTQAAFSRWSRIATARAAALRSGRCVGLRCSCRRPAVSQSHRPVADSCADARGSQSNLCVIRDGDRHPCPHPWHDSASGRVVDHSISSRPVSGPRRAAWGLPVLDPCPSWPVHHGVRHCLRQRWYRGHEDSTTPPEDELLCRKVRPAVRSEVTDRLLMINERHLRTVLTRMCRTTTSAAPIERCN